MVTIFVSVIGACTKGAAPAPRPQPAPVPSLDSVQFPVRNMPPSELPPGSPTWNTFTNVQADVGAAQARHLPKELNAFGVTTDGMVIAVEIADTGGCGATYLVDPATGQKEIVQGTQGKTCPERATGNQDYLVWSNDSSDTLDYIDWHLVVFDRRTRTLRTLAQFDKGPDGRPVLGGFFTPHISGHTIIWWAMTNRPGGAHPDVFIADAESCHVSMLVADAEWAQLAAPYVFYVSFTSFDDQSTRQLNRIDIRDGTHVSLGVGATRQFCFTEELGIVQLIDGSPAVVSLNGERLQATSAFAGSGAVPLQWLSCGDHHIVWLNQDTGPWLLDGRSGKLANLSPPEQGGIATAAGDWLW